MKRWIGIVFLGIFIIVGVRLWLQIKWDKESRFTLINFGNPVMILSFDPSTRTGVKLVLPDNLLVDSVSGRGEWRIGVMDKLGRQWGYKWAADSISDYLGITYTGISGKLGLGDRFLWWWFSQKIEWQNFNLDETSLLVEVKDPDGEIVSRLAEHWPVKAEEWFVSSNLSREQINVNIVNSTDVPGLGAHVARIINNGGVRVISVGNSQNNVNRCLLEGSEKDLNSLSGKWVRHQFGCDKVINNNKDKEMIFTLGQEYQKWWMGE